MTGLQEKKIRTKSNLYFLWCSAYSLMSTNFKEWRLGQRNFKKKEKAKQKITGTCSYSSVFCIICPMVICLFVCFYIYSYLYIWGGRVTQLDLSSPTRDWTRASCSRSGVLTTGPPENSPLVTLLKNINSFYFKQSLKDQFNYVLPSGKVWTRV